MRRAGFETRWLCEVDPFRRKLLAKHWPGVPCYQDLTILEPESLAPVDVLVGGTPCQDLSVAGNRAGLEGERSRLFWDFVRIRNALNVRWCIWENVAGALSSNGGLDFASVVGAFVGATVAVPAPGWRGAGVATGPFGGVVWRVLNAQHFGVPQRRRRVFVVGCLGGVCPPEVLFESACGAGDSASGGEAWARVAAPLTRGSSGVGVSEPGRRKEDDYNLVADTLRGSVGREGGGQKDGNVIVGALDTMRGGPDDSAQSGHIIARPVSTKDRSSIECGDAAGFDGAPADPDGMRAADGMAGRLDVAALSENQRAEVLETPYAHALGEGGGKAGQGFAAARNTRGALDEPDRCAFDPQPDGRRYAACGDGVVAPVAQWIGERLRRAL